MEMSMSDIVSSYRRASNKTMQIRILSELNDCSKKEIRDILEKNGCEMPAAKKTATRQPGAKTETKKKAPETLVRFAISEIAKTETRIREIQKEYENLTLYKEDLKAWLEENGSRKNETNKRANVNI